MLPRVKYTFNVSCVKIICMEICTYDYRAFVDYVGAVEGCTE